MFIYICIFIYKKNTNYGGVIKTGLDYAEQVGLTHYYHVFYDGCLANFEVEDDEEVSKLYPQINYTTVEEYLKRYI